jgi:hypothetical protein
MKKILAFVILILMSYSVFGQDGAQIHVGAFATTNNLNQVRADNIGLQLAGQFCYRGACAGGEGLGNDGRAARSRYWGSYDVVKIGKLALSGGAGFWRFGNDNGGFGQAGLVYRRFTGWGRYGNKNFTEAEGSFRVIDLEHFGLGPFYRYTAQRNQGAEIHQAGLRLVLR